MQHKTTPIAPATSIKKDRYFLTKRQIDEFFICNHYNNENGYPALPTDVINVFFNQQEKLWEHVAYAQLIEAKAILEQHPYLLSKKFADDVMTPSGLMVRNVTPFELALGAGDIEMAAMMLSFFEQFDRGEQERKEQYEAYRSHYEKILTQPAYDFEPLYKTIVESSPEDITAELKRYRKDEYKNHDSKLHRALEQFRKDFTSGEVTTPCLHFNYVNLLTAYGYFETNAQVLFHYDYNQNLGQSRMRLACCQIIGYLLRNLPGRDRQLYVQFNYHRITNVWEESEWDKALNYSWPRSFEFTDTQCMMKFPVTATRADEMKWIAEGDEPIEAAKLIEWTNKRLGYDFFIWEGRFNASQYIPSRNPKYGSMIQSLCRNKLTAFQELGRDCKKQLKL